MMVSSEKRFVFVHIYKTGGSSLTELLSEFVDRRLLRGDIRYDGPGWQGTWHINHGQHVRLEPRLSRWLETGTVAPDYKLLAVVRNPYTWHLSIWDNFYRQKVGASEAAFGEQYPQRRFVDYCRFVADSLSAAKRPYGGWRQTDFLETLHPLPRVIGRFEHYDESVRRIATAIGVPVVETPHRLQREHVPALASNANKEALAILNEAYSEDFRAYGYKRVSTPEELGAPSALLPSAW